MDEAELQLAPVTKPIDTHQLGIALTKGWVPSIGSTTQMPSASASPSAPVSSPRNPSAPKSARPRLMSSSTSMSASVTTSCAPFQRTSSCRESRPAYSAASAPARRVSAPGLVPLGQPTVVRSHGVPDGAATVMSSTPCIRSSRATPREPADAHVTVSARSSRAKVVWRALFSVPVNFRLTVPPACPVTSTVFCT